MIRILVVDDDKLIRWSLTEIFAQEGHAVTAAASADEALSLIAENAYHLIFADMDIARVSGVDMLKRIRSAQPETRIVILSAQNRREIEGQISGLSVSSVLEKPFKAQEIRDIAADVLGLDQKRNKSKKCIEEV